MELNNREERKRETIKMFAKVMMFQGKLDRRIVRIQSKGLLDLEAWRLEIVGLKNIEI